MGGGRGLPSIGVGQRRDAKINTSSFVFTVAFVMTAQFDKCRVFDFPEQGKRCIREQLMSEDVSGKDKYVFG